MELLLSHLPSFSPPLSCLRRQAKKNLSLSHAISITAGSVATVCAAAIAKSSSVLLLSTIFVGTTLITRCICRLASPKRSVSRLALLKKPANSVPPNALGLDGVPEEVLKCIAKLLPSRELAAVSCTSRFWANRLCVDKKDYQEKDMQIGNATLLEWVRVREIFYRFDEHSDRQVEHSVNWPFTAIKYQRLTEIEKNFQVKIFPASFIRHFRLRNEDSDSKDILKKSAIFNRCIRNRLYKKFPLLSELNRLKQMPNLQTLNVFCVLRITDGDILVLKEMVKLEYLNLSYTSVTDWGLAQLTSLTALKTLNLYCCDITDQGVESLSHFPNLQHLQLSGVKITDAGMPSLTRIKQLHTLKLSYVQVSDLGLQTLSACALLQTLELNRCIHITDAGLRHLQRLEHLTALTLSTPDLTDVGLRVIGQFAQLERLMLESAQITDDGIVELGYLTKLKTLELYSCWRHLTEASLHCIDGFHALTSVRIVGFHQRITAERLQQWHQQFRETRGQALENNGSDTCIHNNMP